MPTAEHGDVSADSTPQMDEYACAVEPLSSSLSRAPKACARVIQLLRVAASVEHALMVQYLFAAYSLSGEHLETDDDKEMVAGWKTLILSVAKEEMGHLLTVQNVLCLLGAEPNFGRASSLPFKLERLTIDSLMQYIWVEMPDGKLDSMEEVELILGKQRFDRLIEEKSRDARASRQVGSLYHQIINLIKDPTEVPDDCFDHHGFRLQASWDDWGRSYNYKAEISKLGDLVSKARGGAGNPSRMSAVRLELATIIKDLKHDLSRADVIVDRVANRDQAIKALNRVAEQGESSRKQDGSHLVRFAIILREWDDALQRNVSGLDLSLHRLNANPRRVVPDQLDKGLLITWPLSKQWAALFNLRYRMLLTYLSHSFYLPMEGSLAQVRGAVIHKVFGEMYNLKAIAGILFRLPRKSLNSPDLAGPPFEIPPSLILPGDAGARWSLHGRLIDDAQRQYGDLIEKTRKMSKRLKDFGSDPEEQLSYLRIAQELDERSAKWISHLIGSTNQPQTIYAP